MKHERVYKAVNETFGALIFLNSPKQAISNKASETKEFAKALNTTLNQAIKDFDAQNSKEKCEALGRGLADVVVGAIAGEGSLAAAEKTITAEAKAGKLASKIVDEAKDIQKNEKHTEELTVKLQLFAEKETVNAVGKLMGSLDGLTTAERTVVNDLLSSGKNVQIIPRSNVQGVATPDFIVNGVKTELKTLTGTSLNTPVTRIQDGFKQGAQSVIIDGRNAGLTSE